MPTLTYASAVNDTLMMAPIRSCAIPVRVLAWSVLILHDALIVMLLPSGYSMQLPTMLQSRAPTAYASTSTIHKLIRL